MEYLHHWRVTMKNPIEELKNTRKAFCLDMAKILLDSCRNVSPALRETTLIIVKERIKEYWRIKAE